MRPMILALVAAALTFVAAALAFFSTAVAFFADRIERGLSRDAAKEKGPPEGDPTSADANRKRSAAARHSFTLSFSALATVTLTCLSAGLVIISWVCGLRT